MLSGLRDMEDGAELLPFVSSFYGRPSTYLWEDELEVVHDIQQGEGGEQGDALMPMFFSLGQHRALVASAEQLQEHEMLFAFLNNIYVVCDPDRVEKVHQLLQRDARISLHLDKQANALKLARRCNVQPCKSIPRPECGKVMFPGHGLSKVSRFWALQSGNLSTPRPSWTS